MLELLCCLRALNLYAHHAHNTCARVPFFQDHAELAAIYEKADDDYDNVIERIIGTQDVTPSLQSIMSGAMSKLSSVPETGQNSDKFENILRMKMDIIQKIELLVAGGEASQGTIQMLGDIANAEERDVYKIKQRIKK